MGGLGSASRALLAGTTSRTRGAGRGRGAAAGAGVGAGAGAAAFFFCAFAGRAAGGAAALFLPEPRAARASLAASDPAPLLAATQTPAEAGGSCLRCGRRARSQRGVLRAATHMLSANQWEQAAPPESIVFRPLSFLASNSCDPPLWNHLHAHACVCAQKVRVLLRRSHMSQGELTRISHYRSRRASSKARQPPRPQPPHGRGSSFRFVDPAM